MEPYEALRLDNDQLREECDNLLKQKELGDTEIGEIRDQLESLEETNTRLEEEYKRAQEEFRIQLELEKEKALQRQLEELGPGSSDQAQAATVSEGGG